MSTPDPTQHLPVIFVLGPPGAGKGTLLARLAQDYDLYHLSVGDFLRHIRDQKGREQNLIHNIVKAHLAAGELCPPHVIVPLLRLKIAGVERGIESDDPLLVEHITKAINPQAEEKLEPKPPPTAKTYVYGQFQGGYDDAEKTEVLKVQWIQKPMRAILLDGFPREGAQGLEFEKEIGAPVAVLHVRCVKDEAKKRYLGRGREKDDERLFEQRYAEYVQKSHVVLERYKKIVVEVDTNAEMEVSYERLVKMLGEAEKTGWIVQR